jgi:hypothetical protein
MVVVVSVVSVVVKGHDRTTEGGCGTGPCVRALFAASTSPLPVNELERFVFSELDHLIRGKDAPALFGEQDAISHIAERACRHECRADTEFVSTDEGNREVTRPDRLRKILENLIIEFHLMPSLRQKLEARAAFGERRRKMACKRPEFRRLIDHDRQFSLPRMGVKIAR